MRHCLFDVRPPEKREWRIGRWCNAVCFSWREIVPVLFFILKLNTTTNTQGATERSVSW